MCKIRFQPNCWRWFQDCGLGFKSLHWNYLYGKYQYSIYFLILKISWEMIWLLGIWIEWMANCPCCFGGYFGHYGYFHLSHAKSFLLLLHDDLQMVQKAVRSSRKLCRKARNSCRGWNWGWISEKYVYFYKWITYFPIKNHEIYIYYFTCFLIFIS